MKVVSWNILAMLENGDEIRLADMPDDVANVVDEWLTELEGEE